MDGVANERCARPSIIGPGQLVRIKGNLVGAGDRRTRGSSSVPVALLRGDLMKCNKSRVNANPAQCISRIIQFISKRTRRVADRRRSGHLRVRIFK